MFRTILTSLTALAVVAALSGGILAAPGATPPTTAPSVQTEKHPVLQRSITQLEAIKDRLQKAPSDFGGHKAKAIDAINLAMDELRQAINFDKR